MFHRLLVAIENVGFGLGQFGGSEAVLQRAAEFLLQHRHGILPAVIRRSDFDRPHLRIVEQLVVGSRAPGNRGIFLFRQPFKPAAQHRIGDLQRHFRVTDRRSVRLLDERPNHGEREAGGVDLLVGKHRRFESLRRLDRAEFRVGAWRGRVDHRTEQRFDPLGHVHGVDIAHHDEGHPGRGIIAGVEIREALPWRAFDYLLFPDRKPPGHQ